MTLTRYKSGELRRKIVKEIKRSHEVEGLEQLYCVERIFRMTADEKDYVLSLDNIRPILKKKLVEFSTRSIWGETRSSYWWTELFDEPWGGVMTPPRTKKEVVYCTP